MGAKPHKQPSAPRLSKVSTLVALSEAQMPQQAQEHSFRFQDFLALESPPLQARTHAESKDRAMFAKPELRRRSIAHAAGPEKVQTIDITKRSGRVMLKSAVRTISKSPTTSGTPQSPKSQSPSKSSPGSPGSYRSFHTALLAKLKTQQTPVPMEFTADTNREEPYEYMKYKRPEPGCVSHFTVNYKLMKKTKSANLSPATSPRKQAPKDLMNLLKQAIDSDSVLRPGSRASAMVKQMQLNPKSPVSQQPRKVLTRSQAMATMVSARPRNAFVIQPTLPTPCSDATSNSKSRAERQWQWKGKHGRSSSP